MNIGCDIDGTCMDFSNKFTTWVTRQHNKYILNKDIEAYFPLYKYYEQNNTGECFDLPFYEDCVSVLKHFNDAGNAIIFITKRGVIATPEKAKEIRELTDAWRDKNFPWAHSVIFTSEKEHYAKEKEIDVMIEDDAGNANKIAEYCPVILLSRSWNRHITLHKNVIVAENWKEVEIIIDSFDKYCGNPA